jgi:cholesterol oxidase
MTTHEDTVVIGSGFGGAVAACRLAQAGVAVTILERGRRWPAGGFPRDLSNLDSGWLWNRGQGLYDIKPFSEMLTVTGAGYGGGSLVYANVVMRPPAEVFTRHWPEPYRRATLDPYFDLAAHMLGVGPVPPDPRTGQLPPKTQLLTGKAQPGTTFRPNLAITFTEPGRPVTNRHGRPQAGCLYCGECDIGCNIGAKNSLDHNYLAVAERHGVTVATLCEVDHLEPAQGGGYRIHIRDHSAGATMRTLTANRVILAAGALGSTEILLRSRDQYRTLPDLPATVGQGYSGNGDFLAFAEDTVPAVFPDRGPTITTATAVEAMSDDDVRDWFLVEDGGYSTHLAQLVLSLSPAGLARYAAGRAFRPPSPGGPLPRWARRATDHTLVLLSMGRDHGNGRLELGGERPHLHVRWDTDRHRRLYAAEAAASAAIARSLGGRLAVTPTWRHLRQPVAVHNLGGCRMGTGPHDGVVDIDGAVFGHPGLYVFDGAILPAATGVNPSHTITAVAERCAETLVRSITGDQNWQPPEMAIAVRPPLPEDEAIPATAPRTGTGLRFTETMSGTVPVSRQPRAVRITATVVVDDIDEFLSDRLHRTTVLGTIRVAGLTPSPGAQITSGSVLMLADSGSGPWRTMDYDLRFRAGDGRQWTLRGRKMIHPGTRLWSSSTTLYTTLTPADGGAPEGVGVLRLTLPGFLRQLTTARGSTGALTRYATFFVSRLFRPRSRSASTNHAHGQGRRCVTVRGEPKGSRHLRRQM